MPRDVGLPVGLLEERSATTKKAWMIYRSLISRKVDTLKLDFLFCLRSKTNRYMMIINDITNTAVSRIAKAITPTIRPAGRTG